MTFADSIDTVEESEIDETVRQSECRDVCEDLCTVSNGAIGVKSFENVDVLPESIYVKVLDGFENPVIIKKTTLC